MTSESVKMGEFSQDLKQLLDRHMGDGDVSSDSQIASDFLTGVLALYNDSLAKTSEAPDHLDVARAKTQKITLDDVSSTQDLVKKLLGKYDESKEAFFVSHLIENPGFLSTMGDYVVEETPIEITSEDGELDSFRLVIRQNIRIRRKTLEEIDFDRALKEQSTLFQRYTKLRESLARAEDLGDSSLQMIYTRRINELSGDLIKYGLRVNEDGSLESV